VILGLTIFVELTAEALVTEIQTDRQKDGRIDRQSHDDSIYRASID